ncbi:NF-kappa-B-repressing factor-like [Oculina patagonica]
MAAKRCLWESDIQWKIRSQFIETWKDHYPGDKLAALSMVWANMKFLGCRYPAKTEEIVSELESKAAICIPDKAIRKPKPLIENLTIYEPVEGDERTSTNPVCILNESAQKSKKTISFDDLGVNGKTGTYSCAVTISNKVIAVGEGASKKQAKQDAAKNALEILRPRQPVIRVGSRSQQHESAPCVSKTELVSKAYEKAPSIAEDNIGNQMLRKMGWTGSGGIGKDGQGRAEPVMAVGTDGKFGLGSDPTQGAMVRKSSVQDILMSFISGPDREIKFSNELSKEDRALVHKISQQYGLKHRSYGKGDDRYLVVGKD